MGIQSDPFEACWANFVFKFSQKFWMLFRHFNPIYPFTFKIDSCYLFFHYLLLYWIYPIYPFTFKIAIHDLCCDNWLSYCIRSLPYLPLQFNNISLIHLHIVQSNMLTLFSHLPPAMLIHIFCYTAIPYLPIYLQQC